MAIDQTQVDNYVTVASDDDPAIKLRNLEQEVNLIKTSIKRLLLDLRERMTEFQTPPAQYAFGNAFPAARNSDVVEAKKAALEAREAALEARESQIDVVKTAEETGPNKGSPAEKAVPVTGPVLDGNTSSGERVPPAKGDTLFPPSLQQLPFPAPPEKPNLQKVYRLFTWTDKVVKKFGQDRLEIMLESYRVIGYISVKSKEEILGIVRLMPVDLGVAHEVSAGEYVSELYTLKRILTPDDTSLDRDMIAVLMDQRRQVAIRTEVPQPEECLTEPRAPPVENPISTNMGSNMDWMDFQS
ncbi:hypothetical protein [Methanoregula sp.]|jgi:hypothetical protein|uniref:hypothetical protein n=1 Tax=Methanoregula sp. TaxID=2052170 RepID=UPI0035656F2A